MCLKNATCSTSFNIESEYLASFVFLCEPQVLKFGIKNPHSDAYEKLQKYLGSSSDTVFRVIS